VWVAVSRRGWGGLGIRVGLCSGWGMKLSGAGAGRAGYTLTEVLVVCAIIGILASMMVPAVTKTIHNGRRVRCAGNLRQVSLVMHGYAQDHFDRYPHQVSRSEGGVREENNEVPVIEGVLALHPGVFRAMSGEFKTAQVLICPTTKFWLNRVQDSAVTNTSYAVNLFAKHGETTVPLLTDANISKQWRELREFPKTAAEVDVGYTFERHQALCNISYGDSHVESKKRLRIERPAEGPSRVVRPVR